MKILLDTHTLLWALYKSSILPQNVINMLTSQNNTISFSIASLWEIQIKHDKHPDKMPYKAEDVMVDALIDFDILNLVPIHIFNLSNLENHHNDPFDRLLICQAKCENMMLLTTDHVIAEYNNQNIITFKPL